jgi:hypothetical protein
MTYRKRYARKDDILYCEYRTNRTVSLPIRGPYFVSRAWPNRGFEIMGTIWPGYVARAVTAQPLEGGEFESGFGTFKTQREALEVAVMCFGPDYAK